jgi:hypothetical protein
MIRSTSATTRRYSCSSSMRMAENSSVSRSRSSLVTRLCSRNTTAGARWLVHLALDLGPGLVEVGEIAEDVLFRAPGGRGADDDAAGEPVLGPELADDAAQAGALLARLDLAGDADVIDRRHEDQEAAGHRHVRGDAGPFGAERLLARPGRGSPALLSAGPRSSAGAGCRPRAARARASGAGRVRCPPPDLGASAPSAAPPASLLSSSSSSSSSSVSGARTSVTYRKASRSSPMSTKADCIPGSTFETRPLYTLPATPRECSRSMKISTT